MWRALFDNVYVEKGIADDPETKRILERIGCEEPGLIEHYKDVFDSGSVKSPEIRNLILAKNPGKHLYEGAPVCQSFGNEHFYYSPGVMNCIYDCEYCFLKGMYPGSDILQTSSSRLTTPRRTTATRTAMPSRLSSAPSI